MSLGKALNSSAESSGGYILPIVLVLVLLGGITVMGSFWLKRKTGRAFYTGFVFLMGIALVSAFFLSMGALGTEEEVFILCVGIVYFLLGFLAKKRL